MEKEAIKVQFQRTFFSLACSDKIFPFVFVTTWNVKMHFLSLDNSPHAIGNFHCEGGKIFRIKAVGGAITSKPHLSRSCGRNRRSSRREGSRGASWAGSPVPICKLCIPFDDSTVLRHYYSTFRHYYFHFSAVSEDLFTKKTNVNFFFQSRNFFTITDGFPHFKLYYIFTLYTT